MNADELYYTGRHESLLSKWDRSDRVGMHTQFREITDGIRTGVEAYEPTDHIINRDLRNVRARVSAGTHRVRLGEDFGRRASRDVGLAGDPPRDDVNLSLPDDPWNRTFPLARREGRVLPRRPVEHVCVWDWDEEVAMLRCTECGELTEPEERGL